MPVLKFTDLAVRSLPEGYHYDETLPAFGIWVGKRRKTWIVVRKHNKTKLGHYPAMPLAEARRKAMVAIGTPYTSSVAPPFPEALEQFLALDRWKPNSKYQLERNIRRFFKFTKTLDKISHNEVATIIETIPKKGQRDHSLKDIKTFFAWCVPRFIPHSPCEGLSKAKYRPRTRVLSEDEIKAVWEAAEAFKPFGAIVKLLFLTGARKSEIASLKWENVRLNLTFPETKNGRSHTIPCTRLMRAIIETQARRNTSPYVFPGKGDSHYNGWGKHKAQLDKRSNVTGHTLHDIRRTFANQWQKMGVPLEVTEAALNHVGTRGGIAGVYQTYKFDAELAHWFPEWEKRLQTILGIKYAAAA